uniref:Uncharacterized protein n=1 Tax=Arundo donax TaxID=35708 RepID=A0A0A9AX53_ARUDO
MDFTYFVSLP